MTLYFNTAVVKEGGQPTPVEEPFKTDFFTDNTDGKRWCIITMSKEIMEQFLRNNCEYNGWTYLSSGGNIVWKLYWDSTNNYWLFSYPSETGALTAGFWEKHVEDDTENCYFSNGFTDWPFYDRGGSLSNAIANNKAVFRLSFEGNEADIYDYYSNVWEGGEFVHSRGCYDWVCDITWNQDNTFSLSNPVFYGANVG